MNDLLRDARSVIELQRAIAGDWLPLHRAPAPPHPNDTMAEPEVASETRPPDSAYARIERLIPDSHEVRGLTSLDELREYLAHTILVPIDEQRTQPVLGVGDPAADLMIVGEAPGADEDRLGEPFVGRAGQLLNKILEAIEFRARTSTSRTSSRAAPRTTATPSRTRSPRTSPCSTSRSRSSARRSSCAVGRRRERAARAGLLARHLRGSFHDFHGLARSW
jgi:uracil-DNA glycosylase